MSSDFIERARRESDRLCHAHERFPALTGAEVASIDGLVTVKLDVLGRAEINIESSRTYSYSENDVKMVVIETYNRAIRAHAQRMQDRAEEATEIFRSLSEGRRQ